MRLNRPWGRGKGHQGGKGTSTGATEGHEAIWQSEQPLRVISSSDEVGGLMLTLLNHQCTHSAGLLTSNTLSAMSALRTPLLSFQYSRMLWRLHLVLTAALEKPSSDSTLKQPWRVPCPWGTAAGGPQGTPPPLRGNRKRHFVKEALKKGSLNSLIPP